MKKIKNMDKFGHPISLTFNKSGSDHKTLLGGHVSLIITIFMLVYITSMSKKWWMNEDDNIITVKTDVNISELD